VLVDVDGTLVDSNYHHVIAWSRALRDHGERSRLAAIHRLVGMGSSEMLSKLLGRDEDAIVDAWRRHFDELLPEIVAFEAAGDLLRTLHTRGLVVVLATSSPADLLEHFRGLLGADDAVDVLVTADDVDRAKPHPDIFTAALRKADLDPSDVVVVGDSVWDVEAGRRAGLATIGMETGGFSSYELEAAGAVAVVQDPRTLVERLPETPIAAITR
jgi:HAD superfamily hydrolase (TIGR01509 family)